MSKHIAVLGGGIVGVASAIELLRDGQRVTLVEPDPPGGEQAASYGNATLLSVPSILPMSMPGTLKKLPHYLRDPEGPLVIRWRHLPRLMPWLLRFVASGLTQRQVARAARALAPLVADSPQRHRALAEEAGVAELVERRPVLYPYPDRAAFEAEGLAWRLRRVHGITWQELDEDALRQQEPLLDRRYRFGVLLEQSGTVTDPGTYVAALARHAERLGLERCRARATGFRFRADWLGAVTTDQGELVCDGAVISAGARSRPLAAAAGDEVRLESERGYHAQFLDLDVPLRQPILTTDSKVGVVRAQGGLRVAGTVELASIDAAPSWERAEILKQVLKRTLPGLPDLPPDRVRLWMGNRPSTPDGLPVIGRSRRWPDIIHAYGHGHIGLTSGPMTGRLVADLIAGRPATIDISRFSPQRFH